MLICTHHTTLGDSGERNTMSKKNNKIKRTNRHHRLSRSRTGGIPNNGLVNGIENVIRVDYKRHQAFHLLFPDTDPHNIACTLNNIWIDPTKILLVVDRPPP